MADEKDVAVVETSMANPKQAVNVLENIEKVSAEFTPVNTLQNNAPLFKQEENNEFFNSDAWSDFKTDMFRAYNSKRYPGFAAIETTADNPAYSTIINRYGKAIANRAQAMHSTYAKANSWIGRISDAYNSQRYGLRAAAARKDLSNAIRDGDEAEVARAKMLYQSEQRKSYEEGVEFDDYGNTLMSLAASTARNPATLLVEGVGVAAAPVTAGWSLAAANAINAAIVGADTYKVESGSALQSLDENAPEMTEQQKFEKARVVGGINAAVEAGLFAVGGNIAGRGLQKVGKEAAVEAARSAVRKKTGEEISRDAAKQMIKTDFIKALQNPAKEKAFKDTVAGFALDVAKGAPGEGWQEVFQNSVTDAMLRSVKNGTTLTDEMLDDWADFITNPFDERHADKWETFINVTAASMVLGGGYTAAGTGVRKLGSLTRADTRHDGTGTIQDKALGAYNNSLGLSKLFNWHQNGDAKNALGASNAVLEEQIKRGEVSGKLYTTAEQVQEMQQDPEIAAALEEMGIATSLSESAENGGVVEIDLLAYDRVVNESQNTTLFQKMRNYLSFSDTTMSLNEFNQFINSKGKELASLITDEVRNDQESVYNKLKNMAIKAGRTAERAEGYAVMGHVLLNNLQALTKGEKNDILDRLTLTVDQGNGQILSENFGTKQKYKGQQVQYKGQKRNMFGDVYTADGKPVKYMGIDGEYVTGVNRAAMTEDSSVKVVKMSPSWFLSLTPYKMGDKDVSKLEDVINSGGEIAMPFLTVEVADTDKKTLRVIGHEGRHRSLAMQNLGVNNGYVVLESKDFYRHPELFKDGIANWRIIPQEGAMYGDELFTVEGDARDNYVDVNVGEAVDTVFTDQETTATEDTTAETEQPTTEETATEEIVTDTSATGATPENTLFDVTAKESTFENNFKKNGEIKENTRKAINQLFTTRDLATTGGVLTELFSLIGSKNGKWIKNNVSSVEIVNFANKYDVSPTQIYRAVNIARGKPEALAPVVMPSATLEKAERERIISYLLENNQGRELDEPLNNLSDYELKLLYALDPKFLYKAGLDGKKLAATFFDRSRIYVEKQSLERTYSNRFGGVSYQFGRSTNGTYHLWGSIGNKDTTVIDFDSKEEMDKYQEEHDVTDVTNTVITILTGRLENNLKELNEGISRKGQDYRGGKDVSVEELKSRFGFRTIGIFGLVGKQEQNFLNSIYDSFSTLADTLGIPYTAMSLSGTLGITTNFGTHRSSDAWYDPSRHTMDFVVTKEKISKAIAHEWWHALDNYLARGSTESLSYSGFYASQGHGGWDMRVETRDAMIALMNLKGRIPDFVKRTSNAPRNPAYWSQGTERGARMFEHWVAVQLQEKGEHDNLLTETPEWYNKSAMWLTSEEEKIMSPYFENLFKVMKTEQTESGNTRLYQRIGSATGVYHMAVGAKDVGWTEMNNDGSYNIMLKPEANAVTFAHELFHVFSLEMQRVYNEGTITDYWRKQADKMFKIAGAEPQVDPADPTVVRYFLTEAQEEHLANMFTTYIMKGKIENQEVRGLLSKLIDLFKTTYRQLEGAGLTPMALDSKALEFFNTVMSSQDAIEEIQRNAGLLEILPPEGVDRELYDYYIANLAVSKVEASNDLRKKLYAIDTFKNGAEYTKKMQEFKDNAKAELLEDDKYKVLAQASLYPEDKAQQTLLWAEKNIPEANFTLGDITDILENTPSLEEASTRAAEEEMDKYLAKRFNLTPQDVGFKEERNRAKVRALLAESVMQRGGTIADIEAEIRKADAASDKHLGKTSVYQIMDLGKWKNREAAAVERYAWAKNEGRKDLMSAERYNQAVLNLIMIKSAGFKNEYQKLTALFDKLQSRQRKYRRKDEFGNEYGEYEHRYHAQDWELLRSISENFGNKIRDGRRSMKPVHQQMKEWIQTQVENRFTTVAGLEDFIPFIDKGTDGSIGAMKGKDFKKLWAVMHTIDSIAMREQQLYLDGQYADMNKYIEQTLQFHSEKDIKTDEDKGDWYRKYFGRYGTWQNPEPLLRAIFPPEVFQKIFLPMFNGALKSEAKAKQWIERWKRAKAKINTSNEVFALDDGTQITYGETNKKTMTYGDVANLLIAMGAEHSYENYKLKFGLSDEQAEQIASQAIKRNAKYVEFMNETWNVYGEATELLNDSFQERTNELFVRKEHRAFTIDGIKFEGGYVPEDKHYLALVRELGTWNQGIHNKVENKNEKLITKLADGDILSIIDITETKLSQSAKWAYAAIPYNNVKKFVEKKEVSDVIGERAFNFIRDWLQNWDTPHVDESGVWRPLTRVTTIAALGMRASTALLQVSGLAQAMAHLGPTYLARGMLQFVREGGFFHPFKGPKDKSLYMATRVEDPFAARFGTESQGRSFREIFESYNAKSGLGKIGVGLLSAYQTLAMMGIQIIDGWVATITWNGAYRRALDQGMTAEQAKAEADSVVRVTQSDATQISRSSAMQEPWARSVTAFATWTMAMRSQVVALSSSKSYRKDMVMWLATYAVMSSFIEAFLKEMTEPADEGEEDKEMLERIMNSWYNKIVEAVGTQVMPFAGAGAAGAKMLAGALVNTDDEKIFKVFAGGSVPALQYASRAVQAGAQSIKYMRSGEEEDLDKMLIQTAGLVSYELKKRVKQALED